MLRRPRRSVLVLMAPVVLVAAACGGDDDEDPPTPVTADEQAYVDAIVGDFADEDREAATCFATEVVAAVGVDQLRSGGVTPEDLDAGPLSDVGVTIGDEAAAQLELALAGCGDLVALTIGGSEATDEELTCAGDHLTNEIAADLVVAGLRGEDPNADAEQARAGYQACVDE